MTCIIGLIDGDTTYIGGDSLGSNGYSKTVRLDRKVFKLKDTPNAIIGYTSSFRMGQLLMYAKNLIDELTISKGEVNHEYLVTKFVPNIISLFETGGYSRTDNGKKSGGEFLFAYKNSLYIIQSDYQVGESIDKFNATGCGEDYALGSLNTTEGSDMTPIERIHRALQSASKFSVGCGAPYYIINTSNNDVVEFKED